MVVLPMFDHAAGTDRQLLRKCPKSERIKYRCMGSFILLYCMMSSLALAYACTAILVPSAEETKLLLATGFGGGLCWFLFNYNLYRFLFSATTNGDGLAGISLKEILYQWPKLLLLVMLGACFALSASVALLHDGVRWDISAKQVQSIAQHQLALDAQYKDELQQHYMLKAEAMRRKAKEPASHADASLHLNRTSTDIESDISHQQSKIDRIRHEIRHKQQRYATKVRNMHGFFNTLGKICTKYPLLVLVMIVFGVLLQLFPVLMKMIWVKGPYEYLVDFQNQLVTAKYGLSKKTFMHGETAYELECYLAAEELQRLNIEALGPDR